MHQVFSRFGESKSKSNESFVELGLNGVHLHSDGSQPEENLFVSEPDEEFLEIQAHSDVSSDPISGLSVDFLFSGVQGNGSNVVFDSLPEVNVIDNSLSLNIVRLE